MKPKRLYSNGFTVTVIFRRLKLKIVVVILVESNICFRVIDLVESYVYYESYVYAFIKL